MDALDCINKRWEPSLTAEARAIAAARGIKPPADRYVAAERELLLIRWRLQLHDIFATLPELDQRGMSTQVRRAAVAAGLRLDDLHPFDHRLTGRRPIAEVGDDVLEAAGTGAREALRGRQLPASFVDWADAGEGAP